MPRYGFTFDPIEATGVEIPRARRKEALKAAAEYLKDAVLADVGAGKSPVAGGPWKRSLTPDYKTKKSKESSALYANLELDGDLLDVYDVKVEGSKLFSGFHASQAGKAEGNNIGSYGQPKGDNSKARRHTPLDGETFRPGIISGLRRVLEEFEE